MKVGFLSLLTLLFIGLKLSNIISWSWWWVLSPLWIPLAIVGIIILITAVLTIFADIVDNRNRKKGK
jgi:hypothetical protein